MAIVPEVGSFINRACRDRSVRSGLSPLGATVFGEGACEEERDHPPANPLGASQQEIWLLRPSSGTCVECMNVATGLFFAYPCRCKNLDIF